MNHVHQVKVWDPLVRTFHWSLVVLFALAYLSGDDAATVHIWSGYIVLALVLLRVLWGLIGTRHARFADFVYPAAMILGYTRDMLRGRAKRYLGHNPLGGAMVVIMLVALLVTSVTGIVLERTDQQTTALTPAQPVIAGIGFFPAAQAGDDRLDKKEAHERGKEAGRLKKALAETHEFFANFTLLLVAVHIGGVLLGSLVHRENLVRAMFTGRKRTEVSKQM